MLSETVKDIKTSKILFQPVVGYYAIYVFTSVAVLLNRVTAATPAGLTTAGVRSAPTNARDRDSILIDCLQKITNVNNKNRSYLYDIHCYLCGSRRKDACQVLCCDAYSMKKPRQSSVNLTMYRYKILPSNSILIKKQGYLCSKTSYKLKCVI